MPDLSEGHIRSRQCHIDLRVMVGGGGEKRIYKLAIFRVVSEFMIAAVMRRHVCNLIRNIGKTKFRMDLYPWRTDCDTVYN